MASRKAEKATDKKMKKTGHNLYNAVGSPEAEEAMDETPGMKRGGKAKKRKHGGKVEGEMEKHRADKKSRGGKAHHEAKMEHHKHGGHAKMEHEHHKRASGGRTPYTSGHMTTEPAESKKTDSGHEGQRPS